MRCELKGKCPICKKKFGNIHASELFVFDNYNGNPDETYTLYFHEDCVYQNLINIAEDYARDLEMMEE